MNVVIEQFKKIKKSVECSKIIFLFDRTCKNELYNNNSIRSDFIFFLHNKSYYSLFICKMYLNLFFIFNVISNRNSSFKFYKIC